MIAIPSQINTARDWWLQPARLFEAGKLVAGRAVHIVDGQIGQVLDVSALPQDAVVWKVDATAAPGFFDIQVNGGGGALFNASPTPEGLQTIAAAHRQGGTAWWLPTLVTDAPAVMEAASHAILETHGKFGICGVHFEGPHIAQAKRGVHSARWVRPFDEVTARVVAALRDRAIPVMVTVAPEAMAAGQIAGLVETGAVVALGHTNATARQVRAALEEGASTFTHLFNAMSPMQGREPGAVGTAINSSAYCSVIADGHHVADEMLSLACRARPRANRMIVVTDAMPTIGGPPEFDLYGTTIKLVGDRLTTDDGRLAGAHITMIASVKRLVEDVGIGLAEALTMATSAPAKLMGLSSTVGEIKTGAPAAFVLFNEAMTEHTVWPPGAC